MSTRALATPRSGALRTGVRWNILGLLCLISLLAYVFRQNVSIAGLQIRTELGLTDLQLNWSLSSAIWGHALFQLPGELFARVKGPKIALTAILVLWSVLTMASGVLPGMVFTSASSIFACLLAVRFLLGASQGPVFPFVGGTIAAGSRISVGAAETSRA